MLRFNKITIKNFGPYYGEQSIDIPNQDGVSFVWGLNGFGKTSFLNAVRFVLWGSLANSKYASRPIENFVNRTAILYKEDMMVRLDCEYDGKKCVIIRLFKRNDFGNGTSHEDYTPHLSVSLNATTLSQHDAEQFLKKAFPLSISRFYLFDAELLEQYSKLVEVTGDNTALKLEIESILGLPILEGARNALSGSAGIKGYLEKEYDRVSKADQKNIKSLKAYSAAKDKQTQLESEISDLTKRISELDSEKANCEDVLNENKHFRELTEQEKSVEAIIDGMQDTHAANKDRLSKSMGNLWYLFLNGTIQSIISTKNNLLDSLQEKADETKEDDLLREILLLLEEKRPAECPICASPIDDSKLASLKERLNIASRQDDLRQQIRNISDEIIKLSNLCPKYSSADYISTIKEFLDSTDKIVENELKLDGIRLQKKSFRPTVTEVEILDIVDLLSNLNSELTEGKRGLATANNDLRETKAKIESLRSVISKNGSDDVKRVENYLVFVDTLESIFSDAIACFRDDLKKRVEKTASEIFTNISHNSDYTGLKINDNFGLEILTSTGEIVPNRSEGYEQVVAISLIAALHKNAPIAGPIIMDSTFQRIDVLHKNSTLKELPNMGHQIIVLAYPNEVNQVEASQLLGSHYLRDYYLRQVNSLETKITTDKNG